jgi:uncharacterized protein YceK
VKRTFLLALVLAVVLAVSGCATKATTTTASPTTSTTSAPTTTTADSTSTTESTDPGPAMTFTAQLSGAEVVPAVDTLATGSATFTIDATGTRAYFKLTVSNITDVIASRVHEGKPGSNGQGVLILYPGPMLNGAFTGALAQGKFNASVLLGPLTGKTLSDFAVLLQGGQAYVNVGTAKNPQGEIRGQIRQDVAASF